MAASPAARALFLALLFAPAAGFLGATEISEPAWFTLTPDLSDGPVELRIHAQGAGVQGWSVGLCHPMEDASVRSFRASPRLLSVRAGSPPAFLRMEEATAPGIAGVTQAVVLDFAALLTLPVDEGEGFEVLELEYDVRRDTTLRVCSGLVGSGAPVFELITIDGASYRPEIRATATLVPTPEAWFGVTPPVANGPITVSVHSVHGGIQGWSLALCHDPAKARVHRFSPTDEVLALRHGGPPEFYFEEEASRDGLTGIIQAVVPAFTEHIVLPGETEGGFPVLEVEYDVLAESAVTFCHGLQGSGQPVRLVVTIRGETSRLPRQQASATLIVDPYADTLAYRAEPPQSTGVVTVKLFSSEAAVEGWSFALCHTAQSARILEARASPELEEIVLGEPPDLVLIDVEAAGSLGVVTQTVLLSSSASLALGPFPDGLSLLDLSYDVLAEDELKFCDHVGSLTFESGVRIGGVSYVPRTRVGATLVTGALGGRFIRGDADLSGRVELTDAVVILMSLFINGRALPCLDAADANDVGRVDVSDPIYILRYLYVGGPAPRSPFPAPGADLSSATALGCERGL